MIKRKRPALTILLLLISVVLVFNRHGHTAIRVYIIHRLFHRESINCQYDSSNPAYGRRYDAGCVDRHLFPRVVLMASQFVFQLKHNDSCTGRFE